MFDMVHENIPINFVDGLCGIGWGVEHLIQNALLEGDSDDVLEDIDKKIIERDPLYIEELSLHNGICWKRRRSGKIPIRCSKESRASA
ncbi:MAG: hypothetical protein ACLUEV_04710 [Alistipes sp.]